MSNVKPGSGDLDFGSGDDDAAESTETEGPPSRESGASTGEPTPTPAREAGPDRDALPGRSESDPDAERDPATARSSADDYPYFVRRSNVGDERENRLEVHVRDEVAGREAEFRNRLAEALDTDEVAKTDAREFALLAAFDDPERVAERMRAEGFGILD